MTLSRAQRIARPLALVGVMLAAVGCDDEATNPLPMSKPKAVAKWDPVGNWEMDAEAFLQENWNVMLATAKPSIDKITLAHARLQAMPEAERAEREKAIEVEVQQFSEAEREMVKAALKGPEALRARMKAILAPLLTRDAFRMVIHSEGTCNLDSAAPGNRRQSATGTWDVTGEKLTIRFTTVNGAPPKGKDLKPGTLTHRNGLLLYRPDAEKLTLVAKRT